MSKEESRFAGDDFYTSPVKEPLWQALDLTKLDWFPTKTKEERELLTTPCPGLGKSILVDDGREIFELVNDETLFRLRVEHFDIQRWAYLPEEFATEE